MKQRSVLSFFDRYLSIWVVLCMAAGILIGKCLPAIPAALGRLEVAHVSLLVAVLIWLMIFPMMLKVDFASIRNVGRKPRGLFVTWGVNWLVKPFTMFAVAWFFFRIAFRAWIPDDLAGDYLAGAVLLGAAPCTAMVFVWSQLTKGDAAYTIVQVATNDIIILFAFAPIVKLLLGVGGVAVPWGTLLASVVLFIVVPLSLGVAVRRAVIRRRGESFFRERFLPKFSPLTMGGLLATLVLVFAFQGSVILENPLHIALIAVPLVAQTFFIFFLSWAVCRRLGLPREITAPAAMIGASNFFELSVAVAVSLFGTSSPVALATVVGVLVEVPVMLTLVNILNHGKHT
ncbi:MAG: ACR3 family arsenite efflux transporter [Kiritimatiellae bacterium]|nr:ACR3 family arsenite efflux transporter [Kiritimatiellia bacterium]